MSENPMYDPNDTSAEWLHEGVEQARAEDYKKVVDAKHAWAERIAKLLHRDVDDIWNMVWKMAAPRIQRDYETLTYYIPEAVDVLKGRTLPDRETSWTAFVAGVTALLGVTGLGLEVMLIEAGFTLQLSPIADQIITAVIVVGSIVVGGAGIVYVLGWRKWKEVGIFKRKSDKK